MRGNHVGELRPTCIHLPELRRHGRSQVGANLLRDGQDSKPVWHGSRQALIDGNLHSDSSLDHRFPALLPLLYGPPFFLGNTLVLVGLGIVTGKVRKVEEYGAFIAIDGSANLSGLCHRSEMAERRVEDATQLYEKDDIVKAKVLKVDLEKGQIALGLKASYFRDLPEEEESDANSSDDEAGGIMLDAGGDSDDDVSMGGIDLEGEDDEEGEEEEDSDEDIEMENAPDSTKKGGLVTSGFDWTGDGDKDQNEAADESAEDDGATKRKKRRKAEIQVDRTGDLDANGPQSVADYERLLLGEPDSSLLWLKYMAFQLELGEVDKAREIADRALRTMSIGQDTEKLNVWVARLNLENTFGNDDTLDEVFKSACEYNDAHEIYDRMTSIFIQSGKAEVSIYAQFAQSYQC